MSSAVTKRAGRFLFLDYEDPPAGGRLGQVIRVSDEPIAQLVAASFVEFLNRVAEAPVYDDDPEFDLLAARPDEAFRYGGVKGNSGGSTGFTWWPGSWDQGRCRVPQPRRRPVSREINEPGYVFGDIFARFSGGVLQNTVSVASRPH